MDIDPLKTFMKSINYFTNQNEEEQDSTDAFFFTNNNINTEGPPTEPQKIEFPSSCKVPGPLLPYMMYTNLIPLIFSTLFCIIIALFLDERFEKRRLNLVKGAQNTQMIVGFESTSRRLTTELMTILDLDLEIIVKCQ